jgi:sialate O-acetylesterase
MKKKLFICLTVLFSLVIFMGCQEQVLEIAAPENLRIENNILYFDEVKNATRYELVVLDAFDQEVYKQDVSSGFDLNAITLSSGNYTLKIQAIYNEGDTLITSLYSDNQTFIKDNGSEDMIQLEALGKIEDKIAVNTIFTWTNPMNDTSFHVTLHDEYHNTIYDEDVDKNQLQLDFMLMSGTAYQLKVKGNQSGLSVINNYVTYGEKGGVQFEPRTTAITVSDPIQHGMVVQRNEPFIVRGRTASHILVSVTLNNQTKYAVTGQDGTYSVELSPMDMNSEPQSMFIEISTKRRYEVKDILIGDVYLVSGQSNMQWPLRGSDYLEEDIDHAKTNLVRYFSQDTYTSSQPLDTIKNGKWFKITDADQGYLLYSGLGFMFGSMLSEALKDEEIPIGIVYAAQGDTNIVNWMSKDYYDGSIQTKNEHYNAMIHPFRYTRFKGVVWYQGENNSLKAVQYRGLLADFFANWRNVFENEDLPFYVIQLPIYGTPEGQEPDFSYLREAQYLASLDNENVYLIATADDGNPNNIHPTEKRYIADRITKSVLSTIYGKDYLPQGPIYQDHIVDGNQVIVSFLYSEGLYANETIRGFELAGSDGKYYDATAQIQGNTVILESSKVDNPMNIRYGFGKAPYLNVYNKDGFVMSPFRTDEYNMNINLLDYDDMSSYTKHSGGSDITASVSTYEDETVLQVTKLQDGKSFGSLILNTFGSIGDQPLMLKLKVVGTGSNARILFRFVETSYEIWAYSFIDDFVGVKEFYVATSEFICVYNKQDNQIDYQGIASIEITIESYQAVNIGFIDAMFIEVERQEPINFVIENVAIDENGIRLTFNEALFADYYEITISSDGINYTNPIETLTTTENDITFDMDETYETGIPYYVKVIAKNEIGEKLASNSGFVFYIESDNVLILNNFDFVDQASLLAYASSNMAVHQGLELDLAERGIEITSLGQGWQNFIFKFEKGINKDFTQLKFYADFTGYQGQVVIELVDQYYGIFAYTLDISTIKEGEFIINLDSFLNKSGGAAFDGRDLIWIGFNFNDAIGGIIYFDDCQLLK